MYESLVEMLMSKDLVRKQSRLTPTFGPEEEDEEESMDMEGLQEE